MTTSTMRRVAKPSVVRIRRGRTPGQRVGFWATTVGKYLTLAIAAVVTLGPIVVLFLVSFKTDSEVLTTSPLQGPSSFLNFNNYIEAFVRGNMALGFFNTAWILVISLAGSVLFGSMTAYALDRFNFRGKRLVFVLFLLAALVPSVTTQVATFQIIVNWFNLYDTPGAAIVQFVGTDVVSIYIFIQFMQSIPKSLDEAAMIDGANRWSIYWRVILPLLKPAIATVVIIKGIAIYNEFYIPFLYMPSDQWAVISTSLFHFQGPWGKSWEIIGAGTLIVIIPTLIAFLALQRFIYAGITRGATK